MLRLTELELMQLFRNPGGAEFVSFCNKLIRVSCLASGVPQSRVSTTTRTDAKDGGVDTRVSEALLGDKTGYFCTPSIWQFKDADEANVSAADMGREVNKPRARECLTNGDAYRLCICDHLTDEKKEKLRKALTTAIAAVKETAASPEVLGVDDLVNAANQFPALVLEYRLGVDEKCILFGPWGANMTTVTRVYVPPPGFEAARTAVMSHIDFSKEVPDPVLRFQGVAGVGKTRGVYESFRDVPAAPHLVLYTDDEENALSLANMLANDSTSHAILVADECAPATAELLSRKISGCRSRVRCVCIDNSSERIGTLAPELVFAKPSVDDVVKVLEANYRSIPRDRIRTYAQLSEGFVRLAADMCVYDSQIQQAKDISPVASKIEQYYGDRLHSDDRRKAVEAIALLKRVRHKGEPPTELDQLCDLTGMDRVKLEDHLAAIKSAPGFVERGALYYRVTPEVIAMIAFEAAWRRWALGRESEFLERIPEGIQEPFFERVSETRDGEVRKTVRTFFRKFADSFTPADLADSRLVNRLIKLIETDPSTYFLDLLRVLRSASVDQLKCDDGWFGGTWSPRRQLVWVAERFAAFAEFFDVAEEILFILATHECENDIGNNATNIWQQLYRMQLSGSSLPLRVRLDKLRTRLNLASEQDCELFVGALQSILSVYGSRIMGPPVVGGRLVPEDWRPRTRDELRNAVEDGFRFVIEAVTHPVSGISVGARRVLVASTEAYIRQGWFDVLRPLFSRAVIEEDDYAVLTSRLKKFLSWGRLADQQRIPDEYAAKIEEWVNEIRPKSFHARLVEIVGSQAWEHHGREEEWQKDLNGLAKELRDNHTLLLHEFDWLSSADAKSSFEFGYAVGSADGAASYLSDVVQGSRNRDPGFARGYIAGLIHGAGVDAKIVSALLDQLEREEPLFAFHLALAAGPAVNVFERAVELVKTSKIEPFQLRNFTFWVGNTRTSNEQVLVALDVLLPFAEKGDELTSDVIVDFLGARHHLGQLTQLMELNGPLVWSALVVVTAHPGRDAFWWAEVLRSISSTNARAAIELACVAFTSKNYAFSESADKLLSEWAIRYPAEVMDAIGRLMLDDATGWHFFVSKTGLFYSLSAEVVISWLTRVGVEGARKIARNLPQPYIDKSGEAVVPELTCFVLRRFEDDERVFAEFCAGTHSLQLYSGDIAGVRDQEAEAARAFFHHPLRRVREWAQREYESGKADAERHREWEDEINGG